MKNILNFEKNVLKFLICVTTRKGWSDYAKLWKIFAAAERKGNWRGYLQSEQSLPPVFWKCESLNYLQYGSQYFEKMRTLETEYPDIHKEIHFVAQEYCKCFTVTSPILWMFYCDFTRFVLWANYSTIKENCETNIWTNQTKEWCYLMTFFVMVMSGNPHCS